METAPPTGYQPGKAPSYGTAVRQQSILPYEGVGTNAILYGALAMIKPLPLGKYDLVKIETLDGFSRTNETIQIIIDEHYILPEAMKRL